MQKEKERLPREIGETSSEYTIVDLVTHLVLVFSLEAAITNVIYEKLSIGQSVKKESEIINARIAEAYEEADLEKWPVKVIDLSQESPETEELMLDQLEFQCKAAAHDWNSNLIVLVNESRSIFTNLDSVEAFKAVVNLTRNGFETAEEILTAESCDTNYDVHSFFGKVIDPIFNSQLLAEERRAQRD